MSDSIDKAFVGPLPAVYAEHLVPLIFEPCAVDLVNRLEARQRPLTRVLEIAAGTGVVTRRLASRLPGSVHIVATDLNPGMLEQAAKGGTSRPVEWGQADAMHLPCPDASFDAVVCQFGAMFFPDKGKAFAEARRVLRSGGVFIFSVWDRTEANEFADVVTNALAEVFPIEPPRFLPRTPYGYYDTETIARDVAAGGFTAAVKFETFTARSRAESPLIPAIAYCQGTPLRSEIEAREPGGLHSATDAAADVIAQRFGRNAVDGQIQAIVVTVEK